MQFSFYEESLQVPLSAISIGSGVCAVALTAFILNNIKKKANKKVRSKNCHLMAHPVEKKVVVIGGGIAGAYAAYHLQDCCEITLIDEKEYFEVRWAALRAIVEPEFGKSILVKHKTYLKPSGTDTFVLGKVNKVSEKQIHTDDGWDYDYHYIMFAMGMSSSGSFLECEKKINKQIDNFDQKRQKLIASDSILIIGGGPVGVELAGEIVTEFPTKQVYLVHNRKHLLDFLPTEAGEGALKWLKSKNVKVVLEDKVHITPEMESSKVYVTEKGEKVNAKLTFLCTGGKANTSFLENNELWEGCLDERGFLKVNKYFQVNGKNNIFAVGDVANLSEPKQGYLALMHVNHVVKSLKAILKQGKDTDLTKVHPGYEPKTEPVGLVSLGWAHGLAVLPGNRYVEGLVPTLIKSKALFVDKVKGALGLYGHPIISPTLGFLVSLFWSLLPRFKRA